MFARPSRQFIGPHRHARAIHFRAEDGDGIGAGGRTRFQLRGHCRGHAVDQPLDLAAFHDDAGLGQEILAGRLIAFLGGSPGAQSERGRREALDQSQGLVEREAPGLALQVIVIVAAQANDPKERMEIVGPVGMVFFPGLAGVVGHAQIGLVL